MVARLLLLFTVGLGREGCGGEGGQRREGGRCEGADGGEGGEGGLPLRGVGVVQDLHMRRQELSCLQRLRHEVLRLDSLLFDGHSLFDHPRRESVFVLVAAMAMQVAGHPGVRRRGGMIYSRILYK